jgi:hypothetical protein
LNSFVVHLKSLQMQGNEDDDRRVVLHFDVDAMYVACERELNPDLRDVPVGVCQ